MILDFKDENPLYFVILKLCHSELSEESLSEESEAWELILHLVLNDTPYICA